ncbi:MAG: midcut-by-XrtH protein [Ottowia sp.]|uniref:midcut-by-XrtH protein n=1 Tax=Ottowia sp. TaxID=1898956 RepID=UPI003C7839A9
MTFIHRKLPRLAAVGVASLCSVTAWAQPLTCEVAVNHIAANPASVPSLSQLGLAALAGGIAIVAWRQRKLPGARPMAAALLATATFMVNQGGGGLIQKAYAATSDILNPSGTLNLNVPYGETLTITNRSGVPVRLTSVNPALPGCSTGVTLNANAFCTTEAIYCGNGGGGNN